MPDEPDQRLPPVPRPPWATMATTLLLLFLFAGSVLIVARLSDDMAAGSKAATGAQSLQELREKERKILESYGRDPETGASRIPIERAIETLAAEASENRGELKSFPARKKTTP